MKLFTVGSRGSRLALAQTEWVIAALKQIHKDADFEIKIINTKGDQVLDKALDKIGDKGLFIKELEVELLDLRIDLAVHSMKDMPGAVTEGLLFAKTPLREDPRDVLVLREGLKSLADVPVGGTLGTGSKRRICQLKALRPDLNFVPVRGNIETRMDKIVKENLDGVVLAAAGLHRLGLEHRITAYLEPEVCMPAPAQGALAIEYREGDFLVEALIKDLADLKGHVTATAERAFLEAVGGTCHVPIGAYATLEDGLLTLKTLFGDEAGTQCHQWAGSVKLTQSQEDMTEATLLDMQVAEAKLLGETAAKAIQEAMKGAL